jgi:histidine triad (HIT) family protein
VTFNHEPAGYECPFCFLLAGGETEIDSPRDILRQTDLATAFIASGWWPQNRGHVLVIPNAHHENIYDLPAEYGHAVHDVVREIAVAMRTAYGCDGISTRQHNEPAGGQDAWHYHVHVFPRYDGDNLYGSKPLPGFATGEQRWVYADKIRAELSCPS